jgi:hypothetical protein
MAHRYARSATHLASSVAARNSSTKISKNQKIGLATRERRNMVVSNRKQRHTTTQIITTHRSIDKKVDTTILLLRRHNVALDVKTTKKSTQRENVGGRRHSRPTKQHRTHVNHQILRRKININQLFARKFNLNDRLRAFRQRKRASQIEFSDARFRFSKQKIRMSRNKTNPHNRKRRFIRTKFQNTNKITSIFEGISSRINYLFIVGEAQTRLLLVFLALDQYRNGRTQHH